MDENNPPLNQAARRAMAAQHLRRAILLLMAQDTSDDDSAAVVEETRQIITEAIADEGPGRQTDVVPLAETRTCRDCGARFLLTASEQRHFAGKGLELPRRCLACRRARRVEATR